MKKYRYTQWMSAEEMHEDTKQWASELKFIRDEQLFLNELVRSFTLQLVDPDLFSTSRKLLDILQEVEKNIVPLFKKVEVHRKQLYIIVDGIDQLKMEKAYIETHHDLKVAMYNYIHRYRGIKKSLFELFATILKNEPKKRLQT